MRSLAMGLITAGLRRIRMEVGAGVQRHAGKYLNDAINFKFDYPTYACTHLLAYTSCLLNGLRISTFTTTKDVQFRAENRIFHYCLFGPPGSERSRSKGKVQSAWETSATGLKRHTSKELDLYTSMIVWNFFLRRKDGILKEKI